MFPPPRANHAWDSWHYTLRPALISKRIYNQHATQNLFNTERSAQFPAVWPSRVLKGFMASRSPTLFPPFQCRFLGEPQNKQAPNMQHSFGESWLLWKRPRNFPLNCPVVEWKLTVGPWRGGREWLSAVSISFAWFLQVITMHYPIVWSPRIFATRR